MLHAYGVRSKQIRTLKLTDIDWRRNEIRFVHRKGGKTVVMPITREVGESVLDYLQCQLSAISRFNLVSAIPPVVPSFYA
jgi:integrase